MAQDIKFPRLNSVMISGHLTREVELRYTPKGNPIARLGLAFNRVYLGADGNWVEEVNYINVKSFGKYAESCAEKLHKGSPVIVEGYISTYSYTDKDQQQRRLVEITANKIHFLEKQTSGEGFQNSNNQDFESSDQTVTDDDVPF